MTLPFQSGPKYSGVRGSAPALSPDACHTFRRHFADLFRRPA